MFVKISKISPEKIRGSVFSTFSFLMQAMGQWSLMPRANTPQEVYLSGLLVKIRSRRVDFKGFLRFGLVGSEISCVRLRLAQISFRSFDISANQSKLKSPTMSNSDFTKGESNSASECNELRVHAPTGCSTLRLLATGDVYTN